MFFFGITPTDAFNCKQAQSNCEILEQFCFTKFGERKKKRKRKCCCPFPHDG